MKKTVSIIASILLLSTITIAAAPPTVKSTTEDEIKKPAEWASFEDVTQRVRDSKMLSPAAKALVEKQAQEVEAAFTEAWAPWEGIVKEMRESNKPVDAAQEAIDQHNARAPAEPNATDREAVLKYNRDIIPYNKEAKELDTAKAEAVETAERQQKDIKARGEEQIKKVVEFLQGPSYTEFMDVGQGLLSGRIQFKRGLAWRQLVAAAAGRADEMFDGRRPPPN